MQPTNVPVAIIILLISHIDREWQNCGVMVQSKIITSPFNPLDFLRCELRKPISEGRRSHHLDLSICYRLTELLGIQMFCFSGRNICFNITFKPSCFTVIQGGLQPGFFHEWLPSLVLDNHHWISDGQTSQWRTAEEIRYWSDWRSETGHSVRLNDVFRHSFTCR